MSIRLHQILMRIAYPLGMLGGFLSLPLAFWTVARFVGLLAPEHTEAARMTAVLVSLALFFLVVPGGGMVAVILAGRFVRARCPQCGRRAVTLAFVSADRGVYGCHGCGYLHPGPGGG